MQGHQARTAYLELLKQVLTRYMMVGERRRGGRRRPVLGLILTWLGARGLTLASVGTSVPGWRYDAIRRLLGRFGLRVSVVPDARRAAFSTTPPSPAAPLRRRVALAEREFGVDWPAQAETMAGLRRLDNVEACVLAVIRDGVPGDLLEAGVWRGGVSIFMRAALAAHDEDDRTVWVADSFQGLPAPDAEAFPADASLDFTRFSELSVGLERVRRNFARYGMLDEHVRFLPGWFKDTLPTAPIDRLAILRLDGDLYESTIQALDALYPRLSVGGFCIVDDYGALEGCRRATDDYRARHHIDEPLQGIDWCGAYWRRKAPAP